MKGAGFYLDALHDLFQSKYPAKVAAINARGESHLSGDLKTIAFYSKSERRSIPKYPALDIMPDDVRALGEESLEVAYQFQVTIRATGDTTEEALVQQIAEHEIAVTEIINENPHFAGARFSMVDQADYSDLFERGSALLMAIRLTILIIALEPRRYLTAGEGGGF